jgi:hypothetical protein
MKFYRLPRANTSYKIDKTAKPLLRANPKVEAAKKMDYEVPDSIKALTENPTKRSKKLELLSNFNQAGTEFTQSTSSVKQQRVTKIKKLSTSRLKNQQVNVNKQKNKASIMRKELKHRKFGEEFIVDFRKRDSLFQELWNEIESSAFSKTNQNEEYYDEAFAAMVLKPRQNPVGSLMLLGFSY